MELRELRKIGLTEGEIKVYESLLSIGKSATGKIMKKSNISSSKVYLILDKLIQKGLVSFVVENGVKHFQATNPKAILDYIEERKNELDETKWQFAKIVDKISSFVKEDEESAQVYKGLRGISIAYNNILSGLKKGDYYSFFAISPEEAEDKKSVEFLTKFHMKRVELGVNVRVIANSAIEKLYKKKHVLRKLYSIKHHDLTLPVGVVIGKDRLLFITFVGSNSTAYEIISKPMALRYQEFFDKLWKIAKN